MPTIGYAAAPGASVNEKRKSSGTLCSDAAAAVTLAIYGAMNMPAAFFTRPPGKPFATA